jgi:drug/metabolite transporter (DMT)-like permease
VHEIPPVAMVFLRNLSAALVLGIYLRVTHVRMRDALRLWRPGLVIAVLNGSLPYVLISASELYIDSSLAGILNATAPLWTALLAPLFREAEGIHRRQAVGLAMGFAGVVILARPSGSMFSSSFLGVMAVVAATLSFATATHFSKRHFQDVPPQVPAFVQCALAAVVLSPLLIISHPSHFPSLGALAATLWLGVGATALAMVLAFRLIQRVGASRTIVVTYLIPPSAILWGAVFLHERPAPVVYVALALILGGVFFITRAPALRGRALQPDAGVLEG